MISFTFRTFGDEIKKELELKNSFTNDGTKNSRTNGS
jgi:hypothetical protein